MSTGFRPILLPSERGPVRARLYDAAGARRGVILVGGIGGGFDTPARELYPRLSDALRAGGTTSLRVCFRDSTDMEEASFDVRAAADWLVQRGVRCLGLVGHSFGGAVVIRVAASHPMVHAVVALATQSHGTHDVDMGRVRNLLLLHGELDEVLPSVCSLDVYRRAANLKQIEVIPGAFHRLDEAADIVHTRVLDWLRVHLGYDHVGQLECR